MATLGAVVPFLAVLAGSNAGQISICSHMMFICAMDPIAVSKLLVFVVVIALGLRLLALHVNGHFAYALGNDLGNEIYRRTLYQPYEYHVQHNTSEIMAGVNKASLLIGYVVNPLLQGALAIITTIAIFSALLIIDAPTALMAMSIFAIFYAGILIATKQHLKKSGSVIAAAEAKKIQELQEGLGGIRDILLNASQQVHVQKLYQINLMQSQARVKIQFLQASPRYVIEAAGIILIVILAFWINQTHGISSTLPTLGALAIGAQRLLPQMQHIYHAASSLQSGQAIFQDVVELLDLPVPNHYLSTDDVLLPVISDVPVIALRSICFSYQSNCKKVLNEVSLDVARGSRVGFIGKTGSGKSTLVDLIMGLINPSSGEVLVENQLLSDVNRVAWFQRIAHVPQVIYLSDATLAENIAFGVEVEGINMQRVYMAAEKAQLTEFIQGLPNQYQTHVGERGVQLSGGQRQRIGLARALYKQADILVLDEATSALDDATERSVMQAVDGLGEDLTILMIAHRLSTLRNCHIIYELEKGRIIRKSSYQDIVVHQDTLQT
jgi:ABC-type multidrug transport system fused ATPase/permease subunit